MSQVSTAKVFVCEEEINKLGVNAPRYVTATLDQIETLSPLILLRRPNNDPVRHIMISVERDEDGLFVRVPISRHSNIEYRYRVLANAANELHGFLDSEIQVLDEQPGHYYASCVNDKGEKALLLGPYANHLEALLAVPEAKRALRDHHQGPWLRYGTMRLDLDVATVPVGRLNAVTAAGVQPAP